MPTSHPPAFKRQMVELVRSGCTSQKLSREFEPSARAAARDRGSGAGFSKRNDAGVGGRELPINGSVFLVSITFPGLHLVGEGLQVRNAAVQALSGKDAQFDLGARFLPNAILVDFWMS